MQPGLRMVAEGSDESSEPGRRSRSEGHLGQQIAALVTGREIKVTYNPNVCFTVA